MNVLRPIYALPKLGQDWRIRRSFRRPIEGIVCPNCGASGPAELVRQKRWHASPWRVLLCPACEIAWTDPPPRPVDYAAENFRHLVLGAGGTRRKRSKIADLPVQWRVALELEAALLKRHLKPGARVLDIGCGEGLLMELLAADGFVVKGLDASEESTGEARAAGLDVVTGYFPHKDVVGPFDAVVMSHVLEHIQDFRKTLDEIARIAPGGKLLLVQANPLSLMAAREGCKWHAWVHTQHYWHFTPRGLSKVAASVGWSVAEIGYSSLIHRTKRGEVDPLSQIATEYEGMGDQFQFLAQIR